MAPKKASKKRNRSKSPRRDTARKSVEIPDELLRKVEETLDAFVSGPNESRDAKSLQSKLQLELELHFADLSEIRNCLELSSQEDMKRELTRLAVARYSQQQKVERVFRMLDEAGKGVVVLEDLKRVAVDILGEEVTEDDLIEMIQEVDVSGDGILTQTDLDRVAQLCRL